MIVKTETQPYIDAFRSGPRAGEPEPIAAQREAALARFGALGFPTRRQEAWRFTNLRALERRSFPPSVGGAAPASAVEALRLAGPAHRLVLVNGRFAPELSDTSALPRGAWIKSTAQTLAERPSLPVLDAGDSEGAQPFAALNAAFFTDGVVIALEPGVALERPVEIIHLGRAEAPASLHLRSRIELAPGSRARVIESFAGAGPYWTNAVLGIELGAGAALDHVALQDESGEAIHLALARLRLDAGARYDGFSLTLGGALSRRDVQVELAGEGARLGLNGAYLLRGEQEATIATVVDHAAPGCTTRELFKGVVGDRAHGVFQGSIAVRPQAQKTDAHQLNKNLLLSRRATVDTKPALEILADDVKCSHGATVGDLDESALFYLRARGIGEGEARRMLIEAFAADALDTVEGEAFRPRLAAHLQAWLGLRESWES
ncbi:MAG TPA: Fe-S cluster assembly protein SufD [Stellaceae bacterium]|nr:Fe-S cluster assembly protein SufD [Stellaceae bacterium]